MKIDKNKLEEQRREAALKSGTYVIFEMIIPKGEVNPITNFKIKNCGPVEVAAMISSLKTACDMIKKQYPMAAMMEKYMKVEFTEIIDARKENIVDIPEEEQ